MPRMEHVTSFILRGGQPRKNMDGIAAAGVKELLCVQDGWFDLTDFKRGELEHMCKQRNIKYHGVPLSDFRHPSIEQTKKVLKILSSAQARCVLILLHCLHGVDRTGWMIAAYRVIHQGWTIDAAVAEWHSKGFHSKWYFWWEKSFREMMQDLLNERAGT